MLQVRRRFIAATYVLGDAILFYVALLIMLLLRYGNIDALNWHLKPFVLLSGLWILVFYTVGVYDLLLGSNPFRLFRLYVEAMGINLAVALGYFYLLPIFGIAPRTNLFLYFFLALAFGYAWRIFFFRVIQPRVERGRVLYVGPGQDARAVAHLLEESSLGADMVAVVSSDGVSDPSLPVVWTSRSQEIAELLQQHRIDTVVVGVTLEAMPELTKALYENLDARVSLLDRAELEEATTGRIPLTHVNDAWFLKNLNEAAKAWYEPIKRVVELLLSIPVALFTIAISPFAAAAVYLSSPGPVLYSQIRVGKLGKSIRIWKFRTMQLDAEKHGPQFTASTKADPRIFTAGRIMRQLRIDELPQIWNVIRGDLALVGPRPERPEFVEPLLERMPYYALRHLCKPGLTGWAQTRFLTPTASLEDNLKKLQYDLYYIKHRSPILDAAILLKTIAIIVRRQGT